MAGLGGSGGVKDDGGGQRAQLGAGGARRGGAGESGIDACRLMRAFGVACEELRRCGVPMDTLLRWPDLVSMHKRMRPITKKRGREVAKYKVVGG